MNIASIIEERYKENRYTFRRFNESNPEGVLGCGYVKKNRVHGSHEDFILNYYSGLLVLSGEGYYHDKEHERIAIQAGSFVQRLPDRCHSTIVTTDDWQEIYLCIGRNLFDSLNEIGVISDKPVLTTGLDYEMIDRISGFIEEMDKRDNLELPLLVPEAIAILSRANYLDKQNAHESEVLEMLAFSCQYMQSHIRDRISVEQVAQAVGVGYEKFRKLFTNRYGISPGNYMIRHRVQQAQKLLANPEISIQKVALELGYADAYVFSKQFKSIVGLSPTRFRRMHML